MRGTHRAEFRGIQPNGNSMQVSTACHATFADGQVAEQSVTFDEETLLRQLR
jgi:predicted ester cyclase